MFNQALSTRRGFLASCAALGATQLFGQDPRSRDDVYNIDPLDIDKLRTMLKKDPKADVLAEQVTLSKNFAKKKSGGVDIGSHNYITSQLRSSQKTTEEEIVKLRRQANILLSTNPDAVLAELNKERPVNEKLSKSDADIKKSLLEMAHRIAILENSRELSDRLIALHEKSFPNPKNF